jgi:hypothetical protein
MTHCRLRIWIAPRPECPLGDSSSAWDDECRGVMESVLGELGNPALDADGGAACAYLLNHLTDYSFSAGCSSRSKSWESRGATSIRPPKRHWL